MLKRIKIEGLFNKFNYDIELKEGGLTILTGPNGYGKTTTLRIIHAVASKNLMFFFQLPFTSITLSLEKTEIRLSKTNDGIEIQSGNEEPIHYKAKEITKQIEHSLERSQYRQVRENLWIDRRTGVSYTTEYVNSKLAPEIHGKSYKKQMPQFVDVYLIREQRLIRELRPSGRAVHFYAEKEMIESFSHTIKEYANELSSKINNVLAETSKTGQELDSSFPKRLFDEDREISEKDFNERYDVIKKAQKSLSKYGLSTIKEDSHPSFKEENAKALLVYLDDTGKKLAVFDEILQRLELFSNILNERQFVSKRLEIAPEFGFRFKTEDDKELSLTDLSSGEQQEVVLLYELLFKVAPNTLVLIDEPEISLHVAWQKEVIRDLLKIVELQKITVITATHSPQIIGNYWDLVVDLWEISQ
ncbi:excinuclease ATPase [Candidatus Magnetoovum chiemensis]|nr:excinuclease ATPase [Candidatus Magnetoovum chiemensis]